MKSSFYASAKLLLTGEYLVLKGAKALAVPLKMGQSLDVEETEKPGNEVIEWEAWVLDKLWFTAVLSQPDLEVRETSDRTLAIALKHWFDMLVSIKPFLFRSGICYRFITRSDFDHSWGFGSSSALTANLAGWAGVDPMDLCFKVSRGSGYDVAVSLSKGPILYWLDHGKPRWEPVIFDPVYRDYIWFVYLGCKQDTQKGIAGLSGALAMAGDTEALHDLTNDFLCAGSPDDLMRAMYRHEMYISALLKRPRIRLSLFNDFVGETKSLGAWGGDFAMVVSPMPEEYIRTYFSLKGLTTVFGFRDLILNGHHS